jgi:outer membrane protein
MYRTFLSLIFALILSSSFAQKVGYVDSDYILDKLPEYGDAQKQLDAISAEWQAQIEKKYQLIDQMYKDLQAEEILLTDDMKRKRMEEIRVKEAEALEFQKQKFGVDGDLFRERQKLIKPIQEKVYKAIKDVARASGYAIMMDKAGTTTLIYTNPKYNKSDAVLKELGYDVESKEEDF